MKKYQILYWISTGLFSFMMLATVANSQFNDQFSERFMSLGYPLYLIIPLMLAKVLGVIAIWVTISNRITELAYAGFLFLILLAFYAELHTNSSDLVSPCIAMILLVSSFYFRFRNAGAKSK